MLLDLWPLQDESTDSTTTPGPARRSGQTSRRRRLTWFAGEAQHVHVSDRAAWTDAQVSTPHRLPRLRATRAVATAPVHRELARVHATRQGSTSVLGRRGPARRTVLVAAAGLSRSERGRDHRGRDFTVIAARRQREDEELIALMHVFDSLTLPV